MRQREDEAAALFYACACQARLFGKIADRFLDGVGGAQARRVRSWIALEGRPL